MRLGTIDEVELRDGFPKTAEDLYRYHAIIIDDLEAAFFTQDQLALLRNFVGTRGGGLLMLGGPDSFADGKYDRTPVGELLPVYLSGSTAAALPSVGALPVGAHPRGLAAALGTYAEDRGGGAQAAGRDAATSRRSAAWAGSSRGPSRWPR